MQLLLLDLNPVTALAVESAQVADNLVDPISRTMFTTLGKEDVRAPVLDSPPPSFIGG